MEWYTTCLFQTHWDLYNFDINNTEKCTFPMAWLKTYIKYYLPVPVNVTMLNIWHVTTIEQKRLPVPTHNNIGGVMVNMLASSAVDCVFKPRSGQTKGYKFGICCFSTVGSTCLSTDLFQWSSTITRGSQEPVIAHLDQSCFQ